jgi:hypothetical protein
VHRLDGSTTLPSGLRLRLSMPQRSDAPRLRSLLARVGVTADELELTRALRFDPLQRLALVATALVGRSEAIVGLAIMDRYAEEPDFVLADERQAPGASALLDAALRAHAHRARRSA